MALRVRCYCRVRKCEGKRVHPDTKRRHFLRDMKEDEAMRGEEGGGGGGGGGEGIGSALGFRSSSDRDDESIHGESDVSKQDDSDWWEHELSASEPEAVTDDSDSTVVSSCSHRQHDLDHLSPSSIEGEMRAVLVPLSVRIRKNHTSYMLDMVCSLHRQ
jgi:hypothetical protein